MMGVPEKCGGDEEKERKKDKQAGGRNGIYREIKTSPFLPGSSLRAVNAEECWCIGSLQCLAAVTGRQHTAPYN
jgi:hypothetical protein